MVIFRKSMRVIIFIQVYLILHMQLWAQPDPPPGGPGGGDPPVGGSPLGDGFGLLLAFAFLYALLIAYKAYRKKISDQDPLKIKQE